MRLVNGENGEVAKTHAENEMIKLGIEGIVLLLLHGAPPVQARAAAALHKFSHRKTEIRKLQVVRVLARMLHTAKWLGQVTNLIFLEQDE